VTEDVATERWEGCRLSGVHDPRPAAGPARSRRIAALAVLLVVAMLAPVGPASSARRGASPGAAGIGDPYFPLAGNGGYEVDHYTLFIRYHPHTDRLNGEASIDATATQTLSRLNLDLVGLRIASITVDGVEAVWTREQQHELVVTPPVAISQAAAFTVVVRYSGVPRTFEIPGTSVRTGVIRTDDGAVIWGEPDVAAAWFPVNDHPRDKATYLIALTVPEGLKAISNGRLLGRSPGGPGRTTWSWQVTSPMASYLALAAIGRFHLRRYRTADDVPVLDAIDPRVPDGAARSLRSEERIVRFLRKSFGPYPFDALGGVVDHVRLGAALENQTRPIYGEGFFESGPNSYVVVHELAHQWFGDSVAVDAWRHIWLNEGFATYAEWLWNQERDRAGPGLIFDSLCLGGASSNFWKVPIGDPGIDDLFSEAVYVRGAMTLQAIREAVGRAAFFEILRTWAADRKDLTGTTDQFLAVAEAVSGMQLDDLFDEWLFTAEKPPSCDAARSPGNGRVRVPAALGGAHPHVLR
jgi:aminopeptidase N